MKPWLIFWFLIGWFLAGCSLLQRPEGPGLTRREIAERQCWNVWSNGSRHVTEDHTKRRSGGMQQAEAEMYVKCVEKRSKP